MRGDGPYPDAVDPALVGSYPAAVKSGAGYFYDDVLEYRVWLHPERGAEPAFGDEDYYYAFATYEEALEFSQGAAGAEAPLVLIRQMQHVNEPRPGQFVVVDGERLTEWQVKWLDGRKRLPGSIERFMAERQAGGERG